MSKKYTLGGGASTTPATEEQQYFTSLFDALLSDYYKVQGVIKKRKGKKYVIPRNSPILQAYRFDTSNFLLADAVRLGCDAAIVEFLLQHGARDSIDTPNRFGEPPLYCAIVNRDLETIAVLMEYGADKNGIVNLGHGIGAHTFLQNRILAVDTEIIRILLQHGASVEVGNGDKPLHMAINSMNLDIVKLLLDHGARIEDINDPNTRGEYMLHLAVQKNDLPMVEFFMPSKQ